jgi:hypothetical protein
VSECDYKASIIKRPWDTRDVVPLYIYRFSQFSKDLVSSYFSNKRGGAFSVMRS